MKVRNGMKLDILGDFNEVIEYYKCMIDLAEKLRPNIILKYTVTPEKEATQSYLIAKLRAYVNNIGVCIAQNYEFINEKNGKYKVKDEYILEAFKDKKYFEELIKNNNMNPHEVIKQIRNCLVHGEYEMELKNVKNVEMLDGEPCIMGPFDIDIVLTNGKIYGKINIKEIRKLEYIYSHLNTLYSNRNETYFLIGDSKYASCKNKYFLEKYLSSIRKIIIKGRNIGIKKNDNIDEILEQLVEDEILKKHETSNKKQILKNIKEHSNSNFFEYFEEKTEEVEENKKFLEEYIKYIGLSNYEKMMKVENPYINKMFKEDVIQATFENYSVTDINNTYMDAMEALLKHEVTYNAGLDIKRMSYEGPIVYANMMMGLANYTCVFLRETNNNEKEKDNVPVNVNETRFAQKILFFLKFLWKTTPKSFKSS